MNLKAAAQAASNTPERQAEEAKLRQMATDFEAQAPEMTDDDDPELEANAVDNGEIDPEGQTPETEKQQPSNPADKTGTDRAGKADADKTAAATGKTKDGTTPQESDYARRVREQKEERARLDKSWQELQAEKQRIRQERLEREQYAEARARDAAERGGEPRAGAPVAEDRPAHKYPLARLIEAARTAEANGDVEIAETAWAEVEEARRFARAGGQVGQARGQAPAATPAAASPAPAMGKHEFEARWNAHLDAIVEANPELKKTDTPIYLETTKALKDYPFLRSQPDGIKHAVGLAKLQLAARSVPELAAKIATLEKEVSALRAKTVPSAASGGEDRGGAAKSLDDMSTAERERELRKLGDEFDRQEGRAA